MAFATYTTADAPIGPIYANDQFAFTIGGTSMRKFIMAAAVCLLVGADDPKEAVKKELANLQGEWSMVSAQQDGQEASKDLIKCSKRVCKDDELTVTMDDRLYMKAKITIDPSKKPKTIDYKVTEGFNKGKMLLGIYEVDGDSVKFCFSRPDKERPTDFTADTGSGRTASVWKRTSK
jgi:uncharacterized protein (TIGR03067 family)